MEYAIVAFILFICVLNINVTFKLIQHSIVASMLCCEILHLGTTKSSKNFLWGIECFLSSLLIISKF
jgi:hypothetical protein